MESMDADDPTPGGQEAQMNVSIHEPGEASEWCRVWGVTQEQLEECIAKVGVMVKDIAACLGKPLP
jgi:hypothetical protein